MYWNVHFHLCSAPSVTYNGRRCSLLCCREASFYFSVFFLNPAALHLIILWVGLFITSLLWLQVSQQWGGPSSLSEPQYQMLPSCETATITLEADHHMASNWSIKALNFQVATVLELSGSNNPGFQYWDHKIKIWVYVDKSTVET